MPTKGLKLDAYLNTTVQGTEYILNAAKKNKVKKLIVTSAFTNLLGNCYKKNTGENVYTEKDFPKAEEV